jgi:DNA repair exonuclease SbcCD ATPase subunit
LEQQVLQHEAHSQEATNQLSEERKIVALLREEKDCQTQSIQVLEQELQSKEAKLNEKDQELQQIYDECCQLDQKNQSLEADHRRLSQLYEHQNQKYLSDKEWLTHEHSRLETNLREYIRKIQKLQAQAKSKRHRRKQLQFKSVEQMLLTAQKNFPILDVWHDAEKSAQAERRRQYNFEKIYRALSAIAAIGKEYFECKNCGIALGPLQEAFERHGVSNYRRNETEKTMTFYGNERKFYSGNGRCSVMEQHLTFTAKGSEGALQIFFEFDDERQKVNIGYCGKHLPYAKQNS